MLTIILWFLLIASVVGARWLLDRVRGWGKPALMGGELAFIALLICINRGDDLSLAQKSYVVAAFGILGVLWSLTELWCDKSIANRRND